MCLLDRDPKFAPFKGKTPPQAHFFIGYAKQGGVQHPLVSMPSWPSHIFLNQEVRHEYELKPNLGQGST
jgi:hypothetical protein